MTIASRIVVQDRRRLIREGLADLLGAQPGIEVVAAVALLETALADLGRVDAVLLNASDEAECWKGVRVLRFTGHESLAELVEAVRHTDRPITQDIYTREKPCEARLTSRETDVIRGLAQGMSTAQIAVDLGIARKSVDNHKQRIFVKLDARNGAHAVALALESGFLSRSDNAMRGLTG